MEETIKGLHMKDYTDLDPNTLEEIIQLDNQLAENLNNLMKYLEELDYTKLRTNLKWLIEDNINHRDYAQKCKDDVLWSIECHEASEHFEDYMNRPQTTPCDFEDYNGNHSCPYDAQGGDDCRNFCGLGADE